MIGRNIKDALGGVGLLLVLAGLTLIVRYCTGCTPAEANAMKLSAENALAVKQYDEALEECFQAARQKPKDQRFEAFKDCEQKTIKDYCAASESLREHWPRCKDGE